MTWGADLPGSPVLLNPQFQGAPEPMTEFMIPVSEWSDGTPSPYTRLGLRLRARFKNSLQACIAA